MYPKYTEVIYNLMNNPQTKPLLDKALSTYPLYESTSTNEFIPNIIPTREELNKKILNHYKYREIGFETVGRFLDELEIAMNEIMPYYNQLFFTQDQDYNITFNVNYERTINRNRDKENTDTSSTTQNTSTNTTSTDTTNTNSNVESYDKNVESETPQNLLSISNKNIDNVNYANKASWNKNSTDSEGTTTGSASTNGTGTNTSSGTNRGVENEDEYTLEKTLGNFGVVSAQDLVKKYREIILNTEQMIINDPRITELFMNIF